MSDEKQVIDKKEDYYLNYKGVLGINFWLTLLISLVCAVVTLLSTQTHGVVSSTSFVLYISIIIIFAAVYKLGFWGVIASLLSSILFCITVRTTFLCGLINVVANFSQSLIIWIVLKKCNFDLKALDKDGSVNDYKFLMIALGLIYVVLSFIIKDVNILFFIISGALLLITILASIREKQISKLLFLIVLCVLPSVVGGAINALNVFTTGGSIGDFINDGTKWMFCNLILLSTFGFILADLFNKRSEKSTWRTISFKDSIKDAVAVKEEKVKASAITYYIGMFIWNILFYVMYIIGWLNVQTIFYLFPWIAGNIFMVANFFFSLKTETVENEEKERFGWFEGRAIVAEKSANSIISVIGILFPLFASVVGGVSSSQAIIFTLNLTCAVITLGLIWIPQNDTKAIEIIKNIKTVFSLLTLSLLLLSALMFVVNFI